MIAPQMLTVAEVATHLAVSKDTVTTWINTGALCGIDVSRGRGRKPRWRVDPRDLERFVMVRRSQLAAPPPQRRRRMKAVKEYF